MPNSINDHRKEWKSKAEIDYFAPFFNLWQACNSWYKSHYSNLSPSPDREFIEEIKSDYTTRNHIFTRFEKLMEGTDKVSLQFRSNLEQLYYALNSEPISTEKGIQIDISKWEEKDSQGNIQQVKLIKVKKRVSKNHIRLGESSIVINDYKKVFSVLFEAIYQARNLLVHGEMEPNERTHAIVKYCYSILWELI
ncbi:MAG: hypothetical protein LBT09_11180 [Planctomycetaceae bacterium]|jgi:hypothetical protein|nr:hypothetical protein [Planctomycetaceae bacterium]